MSSSSTARSESGVSSSNMTSSSPGVALYSQQQIPVTTGGVSNTSVSLRDGQHIPLSKSYPHFPQQGGANYDLHQDKDRPLQSRQQGHYLRGRDTQFQQNRTGTNGTATASSSTNPGTGAGTNDSTSHQQTAHGGAGLQRGAVNMHPQNLQEAQSTIVSLKQQLEQAQARISVLEHEVAEEREARQKVERGSPVDSGRKGKLEPWEREKVEEFVKAVQEGRVKVAKGELARELRDYVNGERSQEFYEKLVSRRGLNKQMNHLLLPRKRRPGSGNADSLSVATADSTNLTPTKSQPRSARLRKQKKPSDGENGGADVAPTDTIHPSYSETSLSDGRANRETPMIESFTGLNPPANHPNSDVGLQPAPMPVQPYSHQQAVYHSNPSMLFQYHQAGYNAAGAVESTPEPYTPHFPGPTAYTPQPRFSYPSDTNLYFGSKPNAQSKLDSELHVCNNTICIAFSGMPTQWQMHSLL
eukprot:gb/GECG01011173.1/.p1 GENE.gb/GECG01011173.1/~~gb/GECG01011173.1/.p1  ORF type:complete len:471 (+),score=55.36 gb/GECG01011173.1/:1-1413(+)